MYRPFFSPPTWPMEFVQSLKNFAADPKKWWSDRKSVTRHWLLSTILIFVVVGLSVGITQSLVLNDVDDRFALSGTATIEWYPLAFNCSDLETVVNIFADQYAPTCCEVCNGASNSDYVLYRNLLVVDGSNNAPGSADSPSAPIFQLNTTESCHPNNHYSFASRSPQAYPFDLYFFQISMFASLASTDETVGIVIKKSFGIPINVDITLNPADSSNDEDGVLLSFTVKRSGAVKGLVVLIVISNWLVTITFLWITVAVFIWDAEIVTEMFVLPIGALLRSQLCEQTCLVRPPDYYGILPNLLLMTLLVSALSCTCMR
ncbi:hypothetical protein GGX14DRAFT_461357 [Mycena pura]|uniref:Uncharacterized protein n=1 Tax=Mycena pura TaxID=153505 RepID=A0AAD6Y7F2_9AGAR|nr:hypothetical protein GGX14DRAFT_461357 [Mycena pura]